MMRQYDANTLLVRAGVSADPDVVVEVTPELAGWDYIDFQVRRLTAGAWWRGDTGDHEWALVVLSGDVGLDTSRGSWPSVGTRVDVWSGPPCAIYLPRGTRFGVHANRDSEFAVARVQAEEDYEPRVVEPRDIEVEIRGGDNATRHINNIIPPGFPCQRLVVVEVYTPSGNWSSYPPHKHDRHRVAPDGTLIEADLEEVYYYKIDRADGYAMQRVYTGADSPLAQAGYPIDAAMVVHNDDVVLVPEGYHPVTSAPGYMTYYLNVLAGSAQVLTATDDPAHTWVKGTYRERDPRVPIY